MVQFSRSLKIEWWDSGVDFYVVTPFYVVSNLYKRKTGTIIAPMPDKLVKVPSYSFVWFLSFTDMFLGWENRAHWRRLASDI